MRALLVATALLPRLAYAQDESAPPGPHLVPPRLLEAPTIELPDGAEPLPDDAFVELSITVAADGSVLDASVVTPLRTDVDALVLQVARAMRFEPARRDGAPVPARIRFRYRVGPPARRAGSPEPPVDGSGPEAPSSTSDASAAEPPAAEPPAAESPAAGPPAADAPASVDRPSDAAAFDAEPSDAAASATPTFSARATVDRPEPGAATRITLSGAELSTVPGTFGEPLRVVSTLPGVVRSPFGIGFFVVRGANFNNTGFLIDGFPVPLLYHFGFGPAVVASQFVSRLRFYPGNYPLAYGRFSGGLIALDTQSPPGDGPMVELSIDLLRAAGIVAIPWQDEHGRGSVSAAFRRSYYELLLPLFVRGLQIQYTDYQLRAEYRWRSGFSASVFAFGSDDTLDQSGAIGGGTTSAGTNAAIGINFQRAIARLAWRFGDASSIALSGTLARDLQAFGARSVGQPSQHFALTTFQAALRLDAQLALAPWLSLNTGLDVAGSVTHVDVTAPAPPGLGEYPRPIFDPVLVTLRSSAARGTPGLYAEGVLRFDPVEISVGSRLDLLRYGSVTTVAADPRLVARWQIVPEVLLKVGTGLFTQPPLALQTVSTGGNPRLSPERSWQSSIGTEIALPWQIQTEINAYYSYMFDLPRFSQRIVPGDDGQPRREFFRSDGEGRAYGLEFLVRRPVEDDFYFWISYTLSRSERLSPSGQWVLFNQDQEHVLNLVASYFVDGWRFGARFVLATGRPTSEITGGVYDADGNAYVPVDTGAQVRLPTYHQLDLRIDRDWDFGPHVRGTIYLEVLNVYYARNAEGVIYQYDFARSAPLPGVPVLGNLGIRGSFP